MRASGCFRFQFYYNLPFYIYCDELCDHDLMLNEGDIIEKVKNNSYDNGIPDFALDKHTYKGRVDLHRGEEFFKNELKNTINKSSDYSSLYKILN